MELLDTRQAAEVYGLSELTLRKWRCIGAGPRFVRLGSSIRYRRADLDDYVASRTYRNTTEADHSAEAA